MLLDMDIKSLPTLRELRQKRCLEVPDIARVSDSRENTVYRWERGEVAPRLLEAMKIARALGVRVDEINWWPKS